MGRDGKWRLLRWRNEGLRRAAGGVMRRKWWSAWELRGVARRGRCRKWWFAGRDVGGEVARPVETPEAVDVLRHSLDGAAMGPRPVQACRAWGKLPKAVEVKRVPHRCSVKAFRDTVRAWGSGVESGARFIVAERDGLFLDETGHVDYAARVDFWTEAELRDCPGFGADDADEYHQRAAARRERVRQRPPPAPPPPPAAACQHGDVAEILTFDGFVNRQCRACGEWLPCRRANRAP